MKTCYALVFLLACSAAAQKVKDPKASYIDVQARRTILAHTTDARTLQAVASLKSCLQLPGVAAPAGRMNIPHHYLSGSHGPINPDEAKATAIYAAFERRVTAGMNQWLVTGKPAEAACAQQQIDTWAQAGALLDYDPKESSQAWYQVEWTLSAVATSESVLMNEPSLPPDTLARDLHWLNRVAHRTVDFDIAGKQTNNHHYWRGLAATATGVITSDAELFRWGIAVYKQAINEIDQRGAFPQEMARHERSVHYQSFALQPLAPLAAFAERQSIPLYSYHSGSGRTIQDAVNFLGEAIANPQLLAAYTTDPQLVDLDAPDFFSFAEFYTHYEPRADLPAAIVTGLQQPTFATRIGGSTTVLAGYIPSNRK